MKRCLILLLAIFYCSPAAAHPHAFIDLKTTLLFNAEGQLAAIREHWLFDQYYTEFALHDFAYKKSGALDQAKLLELANENLRNLKDFDYFTAFEDNGVKFGPIREIAAGLENKRVSMSFTLPLAKPLDPRARPIVFRIYDPSYYTAMLHQKPDGLAAENAPRGCEMKIVRPMPDMVWTNLATALDKNATAPDDLGRYFAEKVTITCR